DAVIFLGLGIQSNSARLLRDGPFYPDHGLERIVAFHERQDRRFAEAAAVASAATGKPILVATELGVTDPSNPGPATVRETGRLCYPSANRAVTALDHRPAPAPVGGRLELGRAVGGGRPAGGDEPVLRLDGGDERPGTGDRAPFPPAVGRPGQESLLQAGAGDHGVDGGATHDDRAG